MLTNAAAAMTKKIDEIGVRNFNRTYVINAELNKLQRKNDLKTGLCRIRDLNNGSPNSDFR